MLLELAGVCFPPEVLVVNEGNGFVSIISSLVLSMSIKPVGWVSHALRNSLLRDDCLLDTSLDVVGLIWSGDNLVLLGDHSNLDSVGLSLH